LCSKPPSSKKLVVSSMMVRRDPQASHKPGDCNSPPAALPVRKVKWARPPLAASMGQEQTAAVPAVRIRACVFMPRCQVGHQKKWRASACNGGWPAAPLHSAHAAAVPGSAGRHGAEIIPYWMASALCCLPYAHQGHVHPWQCALLPWQCSSSVASVQQKPALHRAGACRHSKTALPAGNCAG